jgi:hypothetical protein
MGREYLHSHSSKDFLNGKGFVVKQLITNKFNIILKGQIKKLSLAGGPYLTNTYPAVPLLVLSNVMPLSFKTS